MKKILTFLKSQVFIHFLGLGLILALLQVLSLPSVNIFPTSFARGPGYFMIMAIVVYGYFLLLGYAGLASLGTAGFIGLGSYITGYFLNLANDNNLYLPPALILLIVVIVGIILGLVVGFISLRIEGMYLAIITLGLSEMLVSIFKNVTKFTGGISGSSTFGIRPTFFGFFKIAKNADFRVYIYFLILTVFICIMMLTFNLTKSPIGRAMLSMKNSESAAQTMGVSLLKYRLLAFIVATVFAMVGGFLYMLYYAYSEPPIWNLNLSLNILAAVVIGGTASIWGILFGTLIVFSLNDIFLSNIPFFIRYPNTILFVNGFLMILVVMFYPGGISQLMLQAKYTLMKWKAKMKQKKEVLNNETY